MNPELLPEIIEKIRSVSIAVVGDFCLDAYFFIDQSRSEISVETGLPTLAVQNQRYSLGGAGNLANNIISLGVKEVRVFGVIGQDLFGKEMLRIMDEASVQTSSMCIQDTQWSTLVYCKPYIQDKEQSRIDFGNFNQLQDQTADVLIEALERDLDTFDIIIINQQVPSGIHTDYFRKKLGALILAHPEKIFIADIRDKSRSYSGTYLKINDVEAVRLSGMSGVHQGQVYYDDACEAAGLLFKKSGKPVFVTCGSKGSLAFDSLGLFKVPGLMHMGRIDPVGAGDSYLAGAAAALAAGYGTGISAEIGSLAAGVTFRKLFQTGTASPAELMHIGQKPDYIYEPELAEDIRKARYLDETEIEIINPWPETVRITHAIFDHDGTISSLREGWESIMAPMMIRAVLGKQYEQADKNLYLKVKDSVDELIDSTTGVQTLVQMDALVQLIKNYGIVPKEEILDIYQYKEIYNEELIGMVRQRSGKLDRSELSADDLIIKNAYDFLKALHEAGIKLYLASGTDQKDVENEAKILGYAHYFEGGIYGAVGDIKKESKKILLEQILHQIGEQRFGQVVTFGDGPVEIRETRKIGGITVGVASNEVRRYGLNVKKRSRLIKAGADIIIPDFSQQERLLSLLNLK